jgi:hypothetical protein
MIKRLFEKLCASPTPIQIGENMFVVGRDRDNWQLSYNDRQTSVYVPAMNFWGTLFLFEGIVQKLWDEPFRHETIPADLKAKLEQALLLYLKKKGYKFTS